MTYDPTASHEASNVEERARVGKNPNIRCDFLSSSVAKDFVALALCDLHVVADACSPVR
jgi:hypothetical protein